MNIMLENLLEIELIQCYDSINNIETSMDNAYLNHNEIALSKYEKDLVQIMNNISRISHLRYGILH